MQFTSAYAYGHTFLARVELNDQAWWISVHQGYAAEREVAHSISGIRTSYVPLCGEWIRRLPLRCHLWPRCVFLSEQCPNEWAYASATLEMSGITDRYSNAIEVTWIVAFDM